MSSKYSRWAHPKPHKADKGQFNGSCNREVCQEPGAVWFNWGTSKFYCVECAHFINGMNPEHRDNPLCMPYKVAVEKGLCPITLVMQPVK